MLASQGYNFNLKRTRSPPRMAVEPADTPPLPKISGETILQVYTHKSLRTKPNARPEEYEDNERLSVLGESAFSAAVVLSLLGRRPMLRLDELSKYKDKLLSYDNYDLWVRAYGMRLKLRYHPDVHATLTSPQETRTLFHSYVGGLYYESGMRAVQDWVNALLQQKDVLISTDGVLMMPSPQRQNTITPPPKKIRSSMEPMPGGSSDVFFGSQPVIKDVPPHISFYPTPTLAAPITNPLAPAQPSAAFLPLFNQTAAQRRVNVEYRAQFSGPSHAGRWTVECVVNGIPKGIGSGGSKQVAKEEAARQAYYSMGWT